MSTLALTSNTLSVTAGAGQIEYNGQFFSTDSNASRGQLERITQGTAVASTSGTSIDFTGIPAWAKRITVIYSGVSTSGTSNYLIQLGAGSPTTSGYESANSSGASGVATISTGSGHLSCCQVSASSTFSGNIVFSNISGNSWVGSGVLTAFNTPSFQISASKVTLSGTLDRVRITTVNGTDTFDAGSINIMYEG